MLCLMIQHYRQPQSLGNWHLDLKTQRRGKAKTRTQIDKLTQDDWRS